MKKKYIAPSVKEVHLESTAILAASDVMRIGRKDDVIINDDAMDGWVIE